MNGKRQESGLTEIIPLICTSANWGQYPVFSQGSLWGVAAVWWLRDGRYSLFPSRVPSGLTNSPWLVAAISDDCDILCLLIWQAIFHFSVCLWKNAEAHSRPPELKSLRLGQEIFICLAHRSLRTINPSLTQSFHRKGMMAKTTELVCRKQGLQLPFHALSIGNYFHS